MIGRPSTVAAGSLGLLSLLLTLSCTDVPDRDPGQPFYELADHLPIATVERAETQPVGPSVAADGSLSLPAGSSVSFAVFLRADSSLQLTAIEISGRGTRLEIEVETDRTGRQSLDSLKRRADDLGLDLPPEGGTPARLTLRVVGDPGGAAIVTGAALWSPEPDPPAGQLDVEVATADARDRPPNVLIYLIDTLRRDRLGCYGYGRPLTPNLDEFAARATLFTDAVAQSSWTKASVASMFSGVWPPAHGATGWRHKLPLRFDTLAEVLQAGGYRTAAVSGNPNIVEHYDLDQGFETFFTQLKQTSVEINATVFEWLAERDPADPYFLYVHTMDPHAPYNPPEPFRSRFAPDADQIPTWKPRWRWPVEALPYLDALYDADIAFNDHSFGELIAELERREIYNDTMIVVLSDHGEEFREHNQWRHGNNLFPPTLNVPLIIKYPGQLRGSRVDATTQHLDLMPTILETVGLPIPAVARGRRLVQGAGPEGAVEVPPAPIFSHLRLGRSPLVHSVIDGPWKLITSETAESRTVSLFHRRDDPGEENDLAAEMPIRAAALEAVLTQEILGGEPPPPSEEAVLDETMKRDLEALGYLE